MAYQDWDYGQSWARDDMGNPINPNSSFATMLPDGTLVDTFTGRPANYSINTVVTDQSGQRVGAFRLVPGAGNTPVFVATNPSDPRVQGLVQQSGGKLMAEETWKQVVPQRDSFGLGDIVRDVGSSVGDWFTDLAKDDNFVKFALGSAGAAGAGAMGLGGVGAPAAAETGAAVGGTGLKLGSGITGLTGTVAADAPLSAGLAASGPTVGLSGAASGAMAPGFFAAETLAPIAAGTAAGTVAGSSVGGAAAGAWPTLAQIAAGGLPALFGAYASDQQADAYEGLAREYMAFGAPSRERYEASFAPGFSMANEPGYKDALDQTTKSFLHKASVGGNPVDSPNAWMQTLSDVNANFAFPALQNYRQVNANTGGLASFAPAAVNAAGAGINAQRGVYDAIGAGAADIFNPRKSLSDILREMRY